MREIPKEFFLTNERNHKITNQEKVKLVKFEIYDYDMRYSLDVLGMLTGTKFSINELVVFEKPEKYPTNQGFVDKAFALKDYGALFDQIKVSEKYDITADEAYTLSKFKMCKYIKEAA